MSRVGDMSDRIKVDWLTLVQEPDKEPRTFIESRLPTDMPEDSRKREECMKHLHAGNGWNLREQFYSSGRLEAPGEDKQQEITTRLSCEGSCDPFGHCALKIIQYGEDGNQLASMSLEE